MFTNRQMGYQNLHHHQIQVAHNHSKGIVNPDNLITSIERSKELQLEKTKLRIDIQISL